jgi:deoxyguanosine kinase
VAIAAQLRAPDLVVWLQAEPATLLGRVQRRGVPMEQAMRRGYLERLCEAYAEFFESYDEAPVFVVDTEQLSPAYCDADLERLVARLEGLEGRREFLITQVDVAFD